MNSVRRHMILSVLALAVLFGCDEGSEITCKAFIPHQLIVEVRDSVTSQNINTATVVMHGATNSGSNEQAFYDLNMSTYSFALPMGGAEGIGLVVSEPNYHTFVVQDIGIDYMPVSECEESFDYEYIVTLCPLGTSCI